MKPVIFRYGRDGVSKGAYDYMEGRHEESIDGTDRLEIASHNPLMKGDRLVWRDRTGAWHEHVVTELDKGHESGKPVIESTSINSIVELAGLACPGTVVKGSAYKILSAILSGTRWEVGMVDVDGTFEVELWHKTRREAIAALVEATLGELHPWVHVGAKGVEYRRVSLFAKMGSRNVTRQFQYGRNIASARREVGSSDPVTRVIAYGETERNIELARRREVDRTRSESGQEAITWPDLPDATDYDARISVTVSDASLIPMWGTPQADGTLGHTDYIYTDSGCTSEAYLEKQAKRVLRNMKAPDASYEFSLSGMDEGTKLRLGDDVQVLDDDFGGLDSRVHSITRFLGERTDGIVRIGKRPDLLIETFKAVEKEARRSTGNSAKTSSYTPSTSRNTYSGGYSGPGYSGGGYSGEGYGDGIKHTLDGYEIPAGSTIAFTTSSVDSGSSGWGENSTRYYGPGEEHDWWNWGTPGTTVEVDNG